MKTYEVWVNYGKGEELAYQEYHREIAESALKMYQYNYPEYPAKLVESEITDEEAEIWLVLESRTYEQMNADGDVYSESDWFLPSSRVVGDMTIADARLEIQRQIEIGNKHELRIYNNVTSEFLTEKS